MGISHPCTLHWGCGHWVELHCTRVQWDILRGGLTWGSHILYCEFQDGCQLKLKNKSHYVISTIGNRVLPVVNSIVW